MTRKEELKEQMAARLAEYDAKVRECFDRFHAAKDDEEKTTILREARGWASKANAILRASSTNDEYFHAKWNF